MTQQWMKIVCMLVVVISLAEQGDGCEVFTTLYRQVKHYRSYGCGWWGLWTCRSPYYSRQSYTLEVCCEGYARVNGVCTRLGEPIPTPDPTGCGISLFRSRFIVGGTTATYGQYPWQVSLTGYGRHFCGGVWIGGRFILTAAHCVESWTSADYNLKYRVVFGEYIRGTADSHQVTMSIADHRKYPTYDPVQVVNDLALIELDSDVTANDYVKPICLPASNERTQFGTTTTITGWGVTIAGSSSDNHPASTTLQTASILIADDAVCASKYSGYYYNGMICATDGNGDRDVSGCFGDSGGPMTVTRDGVTTLIGITSYGADVGCAMGVETVYTEVTQYLSWIYATISDMAGY